MSDRLNKLHRQKALLQEHMQWLESEIRNESGSTNSDASSPSTTPIAPSDASQAPVPPPIPSPQSGKFDQIIEQYGQRGESRMSTRSGCLLYAGGTLLIIALTILGFWFFRYR